MITEAQIVMFRFPQTDQAEAKLRPAHSWWINPAFNKRFQTDQRNQAPG